MSGLRRIARPPLWARVSERQFLRWCHRETQSHRFASFGSGSVIYPPALIIGHERIDIGDDCMVHPGAFFSVIAEEAGKTYDAHVTIGDRAVISFDLMVSCCGSIEIGDDVMISDRVFIGDTYHEYRNTDVAVMHQGLSDPSPVRIEDGAFLGINSAILPGVTIGRGAYIGANAVVTENVPPHSVAVGNPARVVQRWDGTAWVKVTG